MDIFDNIRETVDAARRLFEYFFHVNSWMNRWIKNEKKRKISFNKFQEYLLAPKSRARFCSAANRGKPGKLAPAAPTDNSCKLDIIKIKFKNIAERDLLLVSRSRLLKSVLAGRLAEFALHKWFELVGVRDEARVLDVRQPLTWKSSGDRDLFLSEKNSKNLLNDGSTTQSRGSPKYCFDATTIENVMSAHGVQW